MMRLVGWGCCWCIISSRRSSYSSHHLYLIAGAYISVIILHTFFYPSIYSSVGPFIYLSIQLSIRPSLHACITPSIPSFIHSIIHTIYLSIHPSICHQPNWMLSPCSPSRRVSLCLTSREQGICVLYRPFEQWCDSYMIHADSCIYIGRRLRMSYCERRCLMLLQAMLRSPMWILPLLLLNDYDYNGVMIVIEWWWW